MLVEKMHRVWVPDSPRITYTRVNDILSRGTAYKEISVTPETRDGEEGVNVVIIEMVEEQQELPFEFTEDDDDYDYDEEDDEDDEDEDEDDEAVVVYDPYVDGDDDADAFPHPIG